MDIQSYNELINDNKMKNRALARTNLNIEALKKRTQKACNESNSFSKEFGNELLLILMNYMIQKYHKEYGLFSFPDGEERLYFYTEPDANSTDTIVTVGIDKSRYYLSCAVLEDVDMLSAIIRYAIDGFENLEKEILRRLESIEKKETVKNDAEKVLTIYQIITLGSCMGYFNIVLDEYFLQRSDRFIMKYYENKKFLIKFINGFCKVDMITGDLIIHNKRVKFENWSNYCVGKGLEYLINEIEKISGQVLTVEAQVGGFTGPSFSVKIDMAKKNAKYISYDYGFSNRKEKEICLDEAKLKEFIYKLYELDLKNWHKQYQSKEVVMDGTNWSIKFLDDKGEFESKGDNAYPKAWNRFCESIESLIEEEFR